MRLLLLLAFLVSCPVHTWAASIENIRIWPAPDNTRLVFDTSAAVTFEKITLDNPDRLVIDIDRSTLATSLVLDFTNSPIRSIRSSQRSDNKLRLVLDLAYKTNHKIFTLVPNSSYGHRLVVDLSNYKKPPVKLATGAVVQPSQPKTTALSSLDLLDSQRDILIAIDAGHGSVNFLRYFWLHHAGDGTTGQRYFLLRHQFTCIDFYSIPS
ncbi:AMIN domain-containing protein [Oceanospirillaceae bacterium]|nr:AMIN domain-containing protein [Oceanospirillaceae bacterium]